MRDDRCTEDLLNVLTVLVTVGGVAVLAAAFSPRDQANSFAVLCASAAVILAAIALVMVELWVTVLNLVQAVRLSARWTEAHRYAGQLHRQEAPNAMAFQFGYALAEGRPAERAWDEALSPPLIDLQHPHHLRDLGAEAAEEPVDVGLGLLVLGAPMGFLHGRVEEQEQPDPEPLRIGADLGFRLYLMDLAVVARLLVQLRKAARYARAQGRVDMPTPVPSLP